MISVSSLDFGNVPFVPTGVGRFGKNKFDALSRRVIVNDSPTFRQFLDD
jgi:hypothetical protein